MRELLLEIYKQCHEHLCETDKTRDQLIAFYLIIVGLIFGGIDKLNGISHSKDIALYTVGIVGIAYHLEKVRGQCLTPFTSWPLRPLSFFPSSAGKDSPLNKPSRNCG